MLSPSKPLNSPESIGKHMKMISVNKQHNDQIVSLFGQVKLAKSFLTRLRGLLGCKNLTDHEGILIVPCRQVHTIGMAFPIDVIFINRQGIIVKVVAGLKPYRSASAKSAFYTLEVAAGMAAKLQLIEGDQLSWS
jgi:hypothetical protein